MSFLDNLSKSITDASQATIKKGKDIADGAKLNSQVSDYEKQIDEIYKQIGKKYVEQFAESPADGFKDMIDEIASLKDSMESLRSQIDTLKGLARCQSCGTQVPAESMFCPSCGTKIIKEQKVEATEADKVKCEKCGAMVKKTSKFCTSCGEAMETKE